MSERKRQVMHLQRTCAPLAERCAVRHELLFDSSPNNNLERQKAHSPPNPPPVAKYEGGGAFHNAA